MKLLRLSFLWWLIILLFNSISTVSAYDLTDDDKTFVQAMVRDYSRKQSGLDTKTQKSNYQKFSQILALTQDKSVDAEKNEALLVYFKFLVSIKIAELSELTPLVSPASKLDYTANKIDIQKIRDYRQGLHTTERATKWKDPYIYNLQLEQAAYTRAKFLLTEWADRLKVKNRSRSTHWRKTGDGYYNYNSIKEWFADQWVVFASEEKNWNTLFQENVWRWYFTCKDSECSAEAMKAIKSTRDMYMKEKKYNGAHYRGITWKRTNMWVWLYISGNRYVLVTHYGMEIQ